MFGSKFPVINSPTVGHVNIMSYLSQTSDKLVDPIATSTTTVQHFTQHMDMRVKCTVLS